MRQLNQLPRRAPTRELSERGTCGSADWTSSTEGRSWASSPFPEAKGTISESGDGAQNTGREAAWAHLVPGASGGGVRGGALAMRNFSGFGLHGARKSVPNSPAWRLRLRKMRQLNPLPPPPTRPLGSYLSGTHVGQRIGQAAGREDPGRRRLFQKRRERSVRAVMVPKTPGEKPPGPILSQAQAEAGSGAEPWRSEIFRILRAELLEKTFGEEARQG